MARRPGCCGGDGPSTDPLVPKRTMRSILGQAPGVDQRAIDLGYPSDVGEDGGRSAAGIGGRPP
jgi:hypothetical protein